MASRIRQARIDDARFIARTIFAAQRGHVPRGWFDIALDWPEQLSRAFVRRIALARQRSWWHTSHFLIAEADGTLTVSVRDRQGNVTRIERRFSAK